MTLGEKKHSQKLLIVIRQDQCMKSPALNEKADWKNQNVYFKLQIHLGKHTLPYHIKWS